MLLVIAACEIGFWVLLGLGLVTRYLLRWRRVSTALLVAVPLLDVVLISASLLDVAQGSPPGATHGLAALYLGFTVAFGHATIHAVDVRFAHRFAGGPSPVRPPKHGPARVAREWREWGRVVLMVAITLAVVAVTALVARSGTPDVRAWLDDPLWSWAGRAGVVAAIWLAAGPVRAAMAEARRVTR